MPPAATSFTPTPLQLTLSVPLSISAEDVNAETFALLTTQAPAVVADALAQLLPGRPITVNAALTAGVQGFADPDTEA